MDELFRQYPEVVRSPSNGCEACTFGRRGRGRATAHVESRDELERFVESALRDMGAVLVMVYRHGRTVCRIDLRHERFVRRVDRYNEGVNGGVLGL